MFVDILRFATVFLFALVVGTYTFEWIVVGAAAKALPPDRSAQLHDALFHNLPNRYMPWAGATSGAAALLLIILGHQSGRSTTFYAVGFGLGLISAVTTFMFSRVVDLQIGALLPDPDPAQYGSLRRKWDRLIAFRAPVGLCGFASYVVATLTA
jgi:hypothetical protein